jgi:hypothetical protein
MNRVTIWGQKGPVPSGVRLAGASEMELAESRLERYGLPRNGFWFGLQLFPFRGKTLPIR